MNENKPETKTPVKLTAEQLQPVLDLIAIQERLGLSDTEFSSQYLDFSATVWGRCKPTPQGEPGEYFGMIKNVDRQLETLRLNLARVENELLIRERMGDTKFVVTPQAEAVSRAIAACRTRGLSNPNRLIVYLADTGGGKSALAGWISTKHKGRVIEAREAWLRSYSACLLDLCKGLGISTAKLWLPADWETALIKGLNSFKRVLVIDEGEFFAAPTLNLLKLILNKTPTVVVLLAIPNAYDSWNQKNTHEARQLLRRTYAVQKMLHITPATALGFLSRAKVVEADKTAAVLCKYANAFGLCDWLKRIADEIEDGARVDASVMETLCEQERIVMGLPSLVPKTVKG